jgi:hypothetical protein
MDEIVFATLQIRWCIPLRRRHLLRDFSAGASGALCYAGTLNLPVIPGWRFRNDGNASTVSPSNTGQGTGSRVHPQEALMGAKALARRSFRRSCLRRAEKQLLQVLNFVAKLFLREDLMYFPILVSHIALQLDE